MQTELLQMSELCHKEGALLKVILENAYLTDELKIIACRCCERAEVDFVETSTGFAPTGYTLADVKLMRKHVPEEIGVKAEGGIRTVDQALALYEAGVARVGTGSTAEILEEWKARLAPPRHRRDIASDTAVFCISRGVLPRQPCGILGCSLRKMPQTRSLPRICIALGLPDVPTLLDHARREAEAGETFLEFRLDFLDRPC